MSDLITATLSDGRTVKFHPDMIGEGGMKEVFFTEDKSSVVCFFKDQGDVHRIKRLEAVLGDFNPTLDVNNGGEHWKKLFCWPTGIIKQPRLGVLAPAYPKNYFFSSGPWSGKEKDSRWFTGTTAGGKALRSFLPKEELGTWINYFKACIMLARAVRRLHQAGLAHSDLSNKNVLIDPSTGQSIVIDIDSLVVPQVYPPDVLGTPGYIAPEVLETVHLPLSDPCRNHPCTSTDEHALAVLIYQYLLFRHPLKGPKTYPAASGEEQERMEMGSKALFVEDPNDTSNRPKNLVTPCSVLGNHLHDLFLGAFVKGLHAPIDRPTALQWERALIKTWDLMYPCPNASCPHEWFVVADQSNVKCPFCGAKPQGTIPVLRLLREARAGNWRPDSEVVIYNEICLFKWHVFSTPVRRELLTDDDKKPMIRCVLYQGKWLMLNLELDSLTSAGGNRVDRGKYTELVDGARIRMSQEPDGRIAEVKIIRV